jgi:hypothetical protein
MSQPQGFASGLRSVPPVEAPAPAEVAVEAPVFYNPEEQVPDLTSAPRSSWPRPIILATLGSILWLALVAATLLLLLQDGLIRQMDATNILAIGGSIFAPLSFIWLVALTSLRGATLAEERERLQVIAAQLLAPLEKMKNEAEALRDETDRQVSRLQNSAQIMDARVQLLAPPLDAQIARLEDASGKLNAAQRTADESAASLRMILEDITSMAQQVATRLPEAAASVNNASTEVALHGEHLESAARTLTQVVSSARDSMAQLLPMLARVTFQTHEASESLSLKLSDLREQAEDSTRKLDYATDKASAMLENSRRWVDGQIEAVEASVARIEQDSSRRIENLAGQVASLDTQSSERISALLGSLQLQLADTDAKVRDRIDGLKGEWQELIGSTESISMTLGVRLLDAMARARAVAGDAMTAAREASDGIIGSAEDSLARTRKAVQETADAAMQALESRAQTMASLASEAQAHARAMRETLQQASRDDLGRLSSQIIDSLNNGAIDVVKILSVDVPDEDWRAYLQGDRSLFARRAARVADRATEVRIADLIRREPEVRESIGRFLRGFESLLKLVMTGGQSDSLALALLSSDWGRLYVALSRAADRF